MASEVAAATEVEASDRPKSSLPSYEELREVSDLVLLKLCVISTGWDTSLLPASETDGACGGAAAAVLACTAAATTGGVAAGVEEVDGAAVDAGEGETAAAGAAAPQAERTGKDTGELGVTAAVGAADAVIAVLAAGVAAVGETAVAAADTGADGADAGLATAAGITSDGRAICADADAEVIVLEAAWMLSSLRIVAGASTAALGAATSVTAALALGSLLTICDQPPFITGRELSSCKC